MNVAILGASDKTNRYSHKAMCLLEEHNHSTILVHPRLREIEGRKVHSSLSSVDEPVNTLAMYVNAGISSKVVEDIIRLSPKRVIFNPGSENPSIYLDLKKAGIKIVEGCVLVMLNTGTF